ncbi:MAG TPA: beta-ketoacyl-[acyl-carrier-protein] synthase family protein [Myxococcales bacterium]
MSRAVITGFGVVSAFGVGRESFFDGLVLGETAVRHIRSFDASTLPSNVAGEVPVDAIDAAWMKSQATGEDPALLEEWSRDGYFRDRKVAFGLLAALEAWRCAGCRPEDREAGLSIALGMEHTFFEDLAHLYDGQGFDWTREPSAPLPKVRLRAPFDLTARLVARHLGLQGPQALHASACAGGALAVAHAAAQVERGLAKVVLCGASDSMVEPFGLGGITRLGAPSPRNAPDACRPFDRRRDGTVMGEGAAMFVVEAEERALARGARPLARILGFGSTQDAYRLSAPRPDGIPARRSMERALQRARLSPGEVGYVNAHGTGTPLNDAAEARAIHAALGEAGAKVPVSSIKGAVGHLMAASGAIEIAACLLPFERGLLPGTANYLEPDPECALNVLGPAPMEARVDAVLSNSFGFGGQNATVVLGRAR